ncbi:MAG: alpha/beta fold hydrolase [Candidatus Micrarchaeota archaeon]
MRVLLIHGWGGSDERHWQSWLCEELKKQNIEVHFPLLPHADLPKLDEWLTALEKEVKTFGDDLVLIGHSLGCPTILHLLEKHKAGKAILVCGFAKDLGINEIRDFVNKPFDWKKIKQNCKDILCISSDNDHYIPIEVAEDLAKNLGVKLIVEHNAEHIYAPKFGPYPRMLELLSSKRS